MTHSSAKKEFRAVLLLPTPTAELWDIPYCMVKVVRVLVTAWDKGVSNAFHPSLPFLLRSRVCLRLEGWLLPTKWSTLLFIVIVTVSCSRWAWPLRTSSLDTYATERDCRGRAGAVLLLTPNRRTLGYSTEAVQKGVVVPEGNLELFPQPSWVAPWVIRTR